MAAEEATVAATTEAEEVIKVRTNPVTRQLAVATTVAILTTIPTASPEAVRRDFNDVSGEIPTTTPARRWGSGWKISAKVVHQ